MSRAALRVTLPPKVGPFGRRRELHAPCPIVGAVRAVRLGCVQSWAFQAWAENEAQAWALDAPQTMPAGSMRSSLAGGYWGPAVIFRGRV